MSPQFRYEPFDRSRNLGTLMQLMQQPSRARAEAMRQSGDAQARAAAASGQAWGGAIGSLGQIAGGAVQQYGEQREQDQLEQQKAEREDRLRRAIPALLGGQMDPETFVGEAGFDDGMKFLTGLKAFQDLRSGAVKDQKRNAGEMATAMLVAPKEMRPALWEQIRPAAMQGGFPEQALPPTLPEDGGDEYLNTVIAWSQGQLPDQPDDYTLNPGDVRVSGASHQPVASNPKPVDPPKAPTVGSFEDYVVQRFGERPTPDQITQARRDYQQADDRPPATLNLSGMGALYGATDPKAIADGIADGSLPPMLSEYGRVVQGAVATELRKQGVNLAQKQSEWKAIQRFYLAKQSTQQLRIRQSADVILQSVDEIDRLADEWNAGGFKALNKVTLEAAKHGALGPEAASLATRLDAQITETIEAIANVYMGGNSPTERAMRLAERQLKGEWSNKVLKDATALARKNTQFRLNAIDSIGPSGVNPQSPYLMPGVQPEGGAETVEEWVRDPKTGKLVKKG